MIIVAVLRERESKKPCLLERDVAKDAIHATDEALLVEGYFDVLALHDAGCANAVGVLGVGVTPRQLETAARFSPSRRVVLALDADAAGDAAVRRLCDDVLPTLADESGVDVVGHALAGRRQGRSGLRDGAARACSASRPCWMTAASKKSFLSARSTIFSSWASARVFFG